MPSSAARDESSRRDCGGDELPEVVVLQVRPRLPLDHHIQTFSDELAVRPHPCRHEGLAHGPEQRPEFGSRCRLLRPEEKLGKVEWVAFPIELRTRPG